MSQKTSFPAGKGQCRRVKHIWQKRPGDPGDFLIIDERGETVWASAWARRAYFDTHPRAVFRHTKRAGAEPGTKLRKRRRDGTSGNR